MPPRDPRYCPALEVAAPADTIPNGTWHREGIPADVLFGDVSWGEVTIVARWKDRHDRPVVQLSWYAAGTGWSEAYLEDPERIREARDDDCE